MEITSMQINPLNFMREVFLPKNLKILTKKFTT